MENFTFIEEEWFTPNTYDANYKYPTSSPGVYLIVERVVRRKVVTYNILYVGSSKNLQKRHYKHPVMKTLSVIHEAVAFYFKEEKDYRAMEQRLIKAIQPKYNSHYKNISIHG